MTYEDDLRRCREQLDAKYRQVAEMRARIRELEDAIRLHRTMVKRRVVFGTKDDVRLWCALCPADDEEAQQ